MLRSSCPCAPPAARPAVLKLDLPHDEARARAARAAALARQRGRAAAARRPAPVGAAARAAARRDVDLRSVDEVEACEIVAELYGRLHVPAPPQLRRLSAYVERWTDGLAGAAARRTRAPPAGGAGGVPGARASSATPRPTSGMIHGDLHYENVLAADREPWLVIDPKPMSGDPHFEPAPMLWNRWDEVVASGNVRDAVRRRFHTLVDTADARRGPRAGLGRRSASVHNVLWTIEDADASAVPGRRRPRVDHHRRHDRQGRPGLTRSASDPIGPVNRLTDLPFGSRCTRLCSTPAARHLGTRPEPRRTSESVSPRAPS